MQDIAFSNFVIKYFMEKSIKTYLKTAAKDYSSRSVTPPVVRASTILFKTMQELRKHQKDIAKGKDVEHWDYGRLGTQTTVQLQNLLGGHLPHSSKNFDWCLNTSLHFCQCRSAKHYIFLGSKQPVYYRLRSVILHVHHWFLRKSVRW